MAAEESGGERLQHNRLLLDYHKIRRQSEKNT